MESFIASGDIGFVERRQPLIPTYSPCIGIKHHQHHRHHYPGNYRRHHQKNHRHHYPRRHYRRHHHDAFSWLRG